MKTLIPAAGYLRMSSTQQDTSIDDQRSELIAYAAKRGFQIVKWYADEGISGWKSKQRASFLSLIADAANGTFKVILCWDQSRFSRFDPMEANFYWHQLRQANVTIETIKEGKLDFESLGGWLSASVQQHGKAEYVRSLAADVTRGRRKRALEGKWSWPAPYGYKIENDHLALGDAAEVEVVRRIFRMRTKGMGHRAICTMLTKAGVPAPKAAQWSATQIRNMLNRKTYLGHMVVGEYGRGKFCQMFDEVRIFENTHPPIIGRELWNSTQKVSLRKQFRKAGLDRPASGGHLTGLLKCGCCGTLLYTCRNRSLYLCGNYHNGTGCSCNTIKFETALKLVADKIRSVVLLGSVEALTAAIEKEQSKRKASQSHVDAAAIKKQMAEIDRKLEGAADRLLEVEASLVKDVRTAMLTLKEKRESLAARLAETAAEKRKPQSAKEIAAGLWELERVLQAGDPRTVQAALAQLIDRVEIDFAPTPMVVNPSKSRWIPVSGTIFFCSTGGKHHEWLY